MDLGIKGKRALILSSSRGLGLGIAQALAGEGVDVMLTGRDADRLAQASQTIRDSGAKAVHWVQDLSADDASQRLAEQARAQLGGVDILVNNTGGPPPGPTGGDMAKWRAQFENMVVRLMALTDTLLPDMRENNWGRIITVGSSGVQQPIANLAMSNVLRSALVGWNKTLAAEVGANQITANMLIPGRIHTDRVDQLDQAAATRQGKTPAQIASASRSTIPLGRYGQVSEFSATAAFLASQQAGYITGSVVRCDGGLIRSV